MTSSEPSLSAGPIPPRLSIVTLGVTDLAAATEFYEGLGWPRVAASMEGAITWFNLGGTYLGLYPRAEFSSETGLPAEAFSFGSLQRPNAVTLAINLAGRPEVDAALAHAEQAGASIIKPAAAAEWGGYSGYFADPDGHLWEVAHNPFSPLTENGLLDMGA